MVKNEVFSNIIKGGQQIKQHLFDGIFIGEEEVNSIFSSLGTGHHLLLLGPPGAGKTMLAARLGGLLGDIEVVEGCPLNCLPEAPSCPWCLEARRQGKELKKQLLSGSSRLKRIQGGGELVPEDLIGALDPEAALTHGIHSIVAFSPGKLLRANRGILLVDFIDRMPERVLNTLLYALEGGAITIGAYEETIPLDILVVATGSATMLEFLPLGVLEYFDLVRFNYVDDPEKEKHLVRRNLETRSDGEMLSEGIIGRAVSVVDKTRTHSDVERGISTRGTIKYSELLSSLHHLQLSDEEKRLRGGALSSLPHRLKVAPHADVAGKSEQIINEILDKVLGIEKEEEVIIFSHEDMLALVEEIVREDKFRKPLKYGAFDLLLKRIQRFPESKLAQLVREMADQMEELYPDRLKADNITDKLLADIEEARKTDERITKMRRELEAKALADTLELLEQRKILERSATGWELSRRGISFLLQALAPKLVTSSLYGYGKHSTGKKLSVGEGREVGVRHFRFGDRYRDVSFKDTIREAIRNRRTEVTKEDIMVTTKDIRSRMDIVLAVDLSGTMRQLEKLWHAKESAIALSLAAAQYEDKVGVVSFSNLADVVVDITGNTHRLTSRVIDLELHENAFTNIGYGILKATQLFARHGRGRATQHIILISDGDATAPHPSPKKYALRQASLAARKGITISCVCINAESTDPELMRRIARIGRGRTYYVGAEGMAAALLTDRFAASAAG